MTIHHTKFRDNKLSKQKEKSSFIKRKLSRKKERLTVLSSPSIIIMRKNMMAKNVAAGIFAIASA